jgi:hypothetical protein
METAGNVSAARNADRSAGRLSLIQHGTSLGRESRAVDYGKQLQVPSVTPCRCRQPTLAATHPKAKA